MFYDLLDSPVGMLAIVASKDGLRKIVHCGVRAEEFFTLKNTASFSPKMLTDISQSIRTYMAGDIQHLDIPLDLQKGTELQRKVWEHLQTLAYADRISYTQLAEEIGRPRAVRAVASACGANPVPLVIPCHRIVAKDGGLGGFAWGLPAKEWLLNLETRTKQAALLAA